MRNSWHLGHWEFPRLLASSECMQSISASASPDLFYEWGFAEFMYLGNVMLLGSRHDFFVLKEGIHTAGCFQVLALPKLVVFRHPRANLYSLPPCTMALQPQQLTIQAVGYSAKCHWFPKGEMTLILSVLGRSRVDFFVLAAQSI